jgi:hypothetical protein
VVTFIFAADEEFSASGDQVATIAQVDPLERPLPFFRDLLPKFVVMIVCFESTFQVRAGEDPSVGVESSGETEFGPYVLFLFIQRFFVKWAASNVCEERVKSVGRNVAWRIRPAFCAFVHDSSPFLT